MTSRRLPMTMIIWICLFGGLLALLAASPVLGRPEGEAGAQGPITIAHRGASGYLPELTLPAFTLAHAQGSDLIETDVVLTKDRRLINLHDLTLNRTTNVEEVFPDRARADGKHWVVDFTLEEIRQLEIDGPADRFEGKMMTGLRIPTFEELIELVQQLNRTTGRSVGLLVEVKDPEFHRSANLALERPVVETLARYGYDGLGQGVVVQSFGADFLRNLRYEHETKLPLVWLFGDKPEAIDLDNVKKWADGIAPSRKRLEAEGTSFAQRAREMGLTLYCWTFQDEPAEMQRFADVFGLTGVITDFPDQSPRNGERAIEQAEAR